ncbi:uncharacterized protein TNIN_251561 [Trichonephila inaurata madagascariensis]|uniref:EGF-like domain-containing protein n=1 Tax=Trichonephila inaurata madagascariensis TaxID=2747483 RepID=A0A8X6XX51_9ARAC|nr:uncharacterized protein TNIN_251561 [Trichonephila inaurata madagascariensis]
MNARLRNKSKFNDLTQQIFLFKGIELDPQLKAVNVRSGFEGNKCEKRKDDRRLLAQCVALGCTQTCGLTNHGDYKCTCLTGYHLAEDKKTCIEKGKLKNFLCDQIKRKTCFLS